MAKNKLPDTPSFDTGVSGCSVEENIYGMQAPGFQAVSEEDIRADAQAGDEEALKRALMEQQEAHAALFAQLATRNVASGEGEDGA